MNNYKDSIQNEFLNMTIIVNLLLHLYKLPPELFINKHKEIKNKIKYNEVSYKIEENFDNKFDFKNNIINNNKNNNKLNKKENEECINNNSIYINVEEEISFYSETNMENKDVISKHFSIYMDDKNEIDNKSNIIKNTNIKDSKINNFEIKKNDISKSDYLKEENNIKILNQNLNHDESNNNKISPLDKNENQSNNQVQKNTTNNRRIRRKKAKKQFCNEDENCCQIF